LFGSDRISDIYFKADKEYEQRLTVPVLWDKKEQTIVNNESSEIIRIFNSAFDSLIKPEYRAVDLYPENLRKEIDGEINEWIYDKINKRVFTR